MQDADVELAISAYVQGMFPMDDPDRQDRPLPFYVADPRAILEIDPESLAALRRKLRRSMARDPGWTLVVDRDYEAALAGCMAPRPQEGAWITERLASLYRRLYAAGWAHSFELRDGERLLAGVLGVVVGRAAMLESMFHEVPHAGNVGLVRTLELLAAGGIELCDIQLITEHTRRLGAREIPAEEYRRRLRRALA